MTEQLAAIREEALGRIIAATAGELESVRVAYLGKKSELRGLLKTLGTLSPVERPAFGAAVNSAVKEIEERIAARQAELASGSRSSTFDYSRPGFSRRAGLPHPIISTIERITEIFSRIGYGIADGPDIEDDAHNFRDLNFPPDHPARDAQDTFFIKRPVDGDERAETGADENPLLLRTHTSPVQIRVMESMKPPLAILIPGRTYRCDAQDATHSPIFHQVEGLVVGYSVSMADLKGTLEYFAKELFGPGFNVRFRPSFFPFTEPSAEVDVSCVACQGRAVSSASEVQGACRVCKGTGWLEILGAGMVDPNVFEAVCSRRGDRVYDPERYTGFAFGMGVERIAMLRHGVDDLRLFFENDPRFLSMLSGEVTGKAVR